MDRVKAVKRIKQLWPDAYDIRSERDSKCPDCRKRGDMYSLISDNPERNRRYTDRDGQVMEDCGHFCANCGWGNAGSREYIPE